MSRTPNHGLAAFFGTAMLIIAWRLAPGPQSHGMLWVVSGMFAASGAVLMMQWLCGAEVRPSPWPGWAARTLWALRPRAWMLAWAAIHAASTVYGTPHVAWEYPPRTPAGACLYVGIRGTVRTSTDGGRLNGCSLIRIMTAADAQS